MIARLIFVFCLITLCVLIAVAYLTLMERKILATVQRRRGPNVVGIFGLLQPLVDGVKLFFKENLVPSSANIALFMLAPIFMFSLAVTNWSVIPFSLNFIALNMHLSLLIVFVISGFSVYGIIFAGWASNSKYAFFGALRSAAQMISYEVSIGFLIGSLAVVNGKFNILNIMLKQQYTDYWLALLPISIMFFISGLVETNRHPFDLPEAEAELVSGYNVEYSAMAFALFFLGEYANIIFFCVLCSLLFFGGWSWTYFFLLGYMKFFLIVSVLLILFVLSRAALPRYRYDQLMTLGWKIFLPLSLGFLFLFTSIYTSFDLIIF